MRTPAGSECRYFYGNYFRGRKSEECRLIGNAPAPHHWTPDMCARCPVPGIIQANACEHMDLKAIVQRSLFGLIKRVDVNAFCHKSQKAVAEPHIGCGECHSLPPVFLEKKP